MPTLAQFWQIWPVALALLVACGASGEHGATTSEPTPHEVDATSTPPPEPLPAPSGEPSAQSTASASGGIARPTEAIEALEAQFNLDDWEQVPSDDGALPLSEERVEAAINLVRSDPELVEWLTMFDEVHVDQVRPRGDGLLVHAALTPHFDPDDPEHWDHGYPWEVLCLIGRSTEVVSGVVWLVDVADNTISGSSPVWADGVNCARW